MTTLLTAAQAMGDELADRLHALVPLYIAEIPFARIPLEDRDNQQFDKFTRARLFDLNLDEPRWIRHDWVGGGSQGMTVDYDLKIAYHRTPGWQDAALTDFQQIQELLWRSPSTTSGVSLRTIEGGPMFVKNQTDPWLTMTMTLRVVYDVTVS